MADGQHTDANADAADLAGGPDRRCLASRSVRPKADLIRFVVGPDGELVPDLAERLPGRGLWLSADRAVLERALARNLFAKAARRPVLIGADLPDRLIHMLTARCGDAMALARRAGQAVAGFEKVRAWANAGRAAVFVLACEASANARDKAAGLARGRPLVDCLPASTIGGAFGREDAVHAALADGGLARRLQVDAFRLAGLLGLSTTAQVTTIRPQRGDGRPALVKPM
ncbi:MAG: RNA-binding protein [Rhodospirillaceae bacterium]|nr:RNA-binding protein [Rhodospirillaceae bacterium]